MKRLIYIWQQPDWPHLRWDARALMSSIGQTRLRQGQLISKVTSLGFKEGQEAEAEILLQEALKTAAIEGEKLNPDSVRSSVAKHLGLSLAGLPSTTRPIDGLVEILLDATTHHQKPLTAKRMKAWQAALFPTSFSGLQKIRSGKWRGPAPMNVVSGPIGRERIHFKAPPYQKVSTEIKNFLNWWSSSFGKTEGLIRAGIAHFYFVTIHPFEDGNGRVARALTDMALAQDDGLIRRYYSFSNQIMSERESYYDVLERSQKGKVDITEWLLWFLGCLARAIESSETLIAKTLAKTEFWKRHAQTPMTHSQRKVTNRLLDAGVEGFEGGLTTRKYTSMTKVSRATAYRKMSDLVAKRVLIPNQGKGRNVSYNLAWSEK